MRSNVRATFHRMEVGGESDDDDDLDITAVVRKQLKDSDDYIADVLNGNAGTGDGTENDEQDAVTKLDWSSEDDAGDTYLAFKTRKGTKRKRASVEVTGVKSRAQPRGKQPVSKSVVGRKPAPRHVTTKARKAKQSEGLETNDLLDDENMPEYVKDRKSRLSRARERLGEAGLRLPPSFDDIFFSDEEELATIAEKPILPNFTPCRKYEDILLMYSGGVVPASIAQWLRDYQVKGAQFLHKLFVMQEGGILGDDMGLGKTIQVISFLTAAFGKTGDARDNKRMRKFVRRSEQRGDRPWYPRVLIICPVGLIANWKEELERWGWWQVSVYHDKAHGGKEVALELATAGRLEIMITAYDTYRIDMSAINTVEWDCVVADECHNIKNREAATTRAMNDINALCRIGLTGTAIQNNYDELWTLLNWSNPGRFGSLSNWRQSISKPLRIGQAHDATGYQLGLARRTAYKLVNNLLPPFFLRRMKSLIADQLPRKSDRVVFCPLTETQSEAYQYYLDSDIIETIRTASEPCPCGSSKKRGWCCYQRVEGYGDWQNHVFPRIQTLQKLANHLALLIPSGFDPVEKQGKDLDHLKTAVPGGWRDLYATKDSINNYANEEFCGKWKILKKLLHLWYGDGDKVLVFSHSVKLLKMLHLLFTSKTSYNVSYLDGSMVVDERAAAVSEFNASPTQFVFLISTRAGGVGLNIVSANKVVIFDPNWNPAWDLQAQDRAYRIGQMRDVEVFRLISSGTIEEIVYARQIYKQQQANIGYTASSERRYFTGVQNDASKKGEIFGLANLFAYKNEGVVLQEIVNKTNVAESKMGVIIGDISASQTLEEEEASDPQKTADKAIEDLSAVICAGKYDEELEDKQTQMDPVQAILRAAGVQYTHENSEVIGTSKTEARISRRAAENTTTIDGNDRPVFQSTSQSDVSGDNAVKWKFQPPEAVRRRQFCTMAKMFGFKTATEFALVVEGWTQEQRRNCLEKFYYERKVMLGKHEQQAVVAEVIDDGGGHDDDEL